MQQGQITKKQAAEVLVQATGLLKVTRAEHELIIEALKVLTADSAPMPKPEIAAVSEIKPGLDKA